MITPKHKHAIHKIYKGLKHKEITWAITGSLGFALHGINVPVNDIDIQTDSDGAYRIEKAFQQHVVKKVSFCGTDTIQSHLGELNVGGLKVEIMGGIQKRLPGGDWDSPVKVNKYIEILSFEGIDLPVLSLEYEEKAYRKMGRTRKAELIKQWLDNVSSKKTV